MKTLELGGKLVTLYGLPKDVGDAPAEAVRLPVVFLNTVMGEGEAVYAACRKLGAPPFILAVVSRVNWSDDMTPWPTDALARWEARCGGMADAYLEKLEAVIVPGVLAELAACGVEAAGLSLAGYSLGGLFALYALWKTPLFTRAASASGSLWYPDFVAFCESHELAGSPDRVYLSLGRKESKARSKRTADLEANTRRIAQLLEERGADAAFELNPGGHTHEADRRMARAILALIE